MRNPDPGGTGARDRLGTSLGSDAPEFIAASCKLQVIPSLHRGSRLTNQTTVLEAPAHEHSRKPAEFYELVESLCVGRMLDYFSREKRPGWAQYGNETAKFGGAA